MVHITDWQTPPEVARNALLCRGANTRHEHIGPVVE